MTTTKEQIAIAYLDTFIEKALKHGLLFDFEAYEDIYAALQPRPDRKAQLKEMLDQITPENMGDCQ